MAVSIKFDATEIVPGLFQGAAPPVGSALKDAGFNTAVLCAQEWQPPKFVDPTVRLEMGYIGLNHPYPGVTIAYAPNDDDFIVPPSRETLTLVLKAAKYVADQVLAGNKVHVSCRAGKNRSGLVTTLALHRLTGRSGAACMKIVKKARPQALTNPLFVAMLHNVQAASAPVVV